jgi:Phosphotransferase enzyme family
LIAGQFPHWAQLPIRPVVSGGWDNRIFHLGHDTTVRLPSAQRYAAQVEKKQRWLLGLATLLPLPIPVPLAMGEPALGYPWHWSVYRWLEGEVVTIERIANLRSASQNFFSLCSGSTLLVGLDLGPTTSIAADQLRSMTRRLVRQSETWGNGRWGRSDFSLEASLED